MTETISMFSETETLRAETRKEHDRFEELAGVFTDPLILHSGSASSSHGSSPSRSRENFLALPPALRPEGRRAFLSPITTHQKPRKTLSFLSPAS